MKKEKHSRLMRCLCSWILLSASIAPIITYAANDELTVGVFPRRNAEVTIEMFTPLVNHLAKKLRRPVRLVVRKDLESFWDGVARQQFDIVHYNQYQYIRSVKVFGYKIIVKNEEFGDDSLAGALIVRKDSGINSLQDLRGKKIVFGGGPSAMISYIMTTQMLRKAGLMEGDYTKEYAVNPPNAVFSVYYDHAAAGGAGNIALKIPVVSKKVDVSQLKYLAQSKKLPHLPWSVKGDMAPELQQQIQAIMADLTSTADGKKILKQAGLTGLNPAIDEEYDEYRQVVSEILNEEYCVRNCGQLANDAAGPDKSLLVMGIFPRRAQKLTEKLFQPMADHLSQQLGRKVQLVSSKTFKEFWRGVKNKKYDLVHYNQYHYIKSNKLYGYDVILKNEEFGNDKVTPAIYVRKDSGINSLQELKGKKIIFGAGKMAMVSYIGNTFQLQQAGLQEKDYKKSIAINPLDGCVGMFKGQADACGAGTGLMQLPSVRKAIDFSQVKVLSKGKPFTHLSWAVKGTLDAGTRQRIQTVLTKLKTSAAGKKVLQAAKLTNLKKSTDEEYDEHRRQVWNVTQEDYCVRNCDAMKNNVRIEHTEPKFVMSVFPRREMRKTAKMFQPMADYLSQKLGREVRLETHKTFKGFWKGIKERRYDIIHANQFQYIRSRKMYGYDVILKNEEFGRQTITPAIYVRKDSGIKSLKDLKGKKIIFGGGKLAMVSYVGNLQLLQNAGLKDDDYQWKFAVNPPNGCVAMFKGQADACGAAKVLLRLPSFTKRVDISQMHMLAENIPLAHVNWAVKGKMDKVLRTKVQHLLSNLYKDEAGRKLLKSAGLTKLIAANDEEYDIHRKIVKEVLDENY